MNTIDSQRVLFFHSFAASTRISGSEPRKRTAIWKKKGKMSPRRLEAKFNSEIRCNPSKAPVALSRTIENSRGGGIVADEDREPESLHTAMMQDLVNGIQQGDMQAKNDLVRRVADRLERLTRKMLHNFPTV